MREVLSSLVPTSLIPRALLFVYDSGEAQVRETGTISSK